MNIPCLYDTGALIAVDDDRRMWARHEPAPEDGRDIHVPSVVVSQAWRDSRRQARPGRFLTGCRVEPVGLAVAKAAGILCGRAGTADIVDAAVVVMAATLGAVIRTSAPDDSHALIGALDVEPALVVRYPAAAGTAPAYADDACALLQPRVLRTRR